MTRLPTLPDLGTLTAPLRRNVAAKLFAAVFAFVLWFLVNTGERETGVFHFPVELRNLPPDTIMVERNPVDSVAVRLNGPGLLLATLDTRRSPIMLDLAEVRVGAETTLKIREALIRIPRGVRILDIEPSRVPVHLETVEQASLPVVVRRAGEPRDGYRIESVAVRPRTVAVTGPASLVAGLQEVETEPIDLEDLIAPAQRTVALVRGDPLLTLKPDRVTVDVAVQPLVISREFKRVEVEVRHVDRPFQLRPPRVNLTVRGPQAVVKSLTLEPGSVYVEGKEYGQGQHTVVAEVHLPPGVEVVRLQPASLRLEIQKQKDGA
jgi:YbbR domain-containing protein